MKKPFRAPLRQVIEWVSFPDKKPERGQGQCLFSDGVSYWVGWWSTEEQKLYVVTADGTNSVLAHVGAIDHADIRVWAPLCNIVADVEKHFGRLQPPAGPRPHKGRTDDEDCGRR